MSAPKPKSQGEDDSGGKDKKPKKTALGVKIQNSKKKRQFKGREKGR